ncbi:unnamed protein product [Aureobasidium mustum]|uniref:Uncharacterized protein n=1 Tax=Aureobasidium mustum TaxID=2773714 RepID=A0A9N8JZJ2_9PEZI|nr:unnamed protein product [Aureobasidium mustum]
MSHEALPIDRARFAEALESLPLDALHSKVAELRNNMNHLRYSNEQMVPFADEGDQGMSTFSSGRSKLILRFEDCKDAMYENLVVISRMNERIELLRAEVEKRGMRWSEGEVEDRQVSERMVNGDSAPVTTSQSQPQSGRLTDEQLRAQLEARLNQDTQDDQEEEGLHL